MAAQLRCHVIENVRARTASCQLVLRMDCRESALLVSVLLLALDLCSAQNYVLSDDGGLGRVFDGIGGLSGGGVSLVYFTRVLPCTTLPPQEQSDLCMPACMFLFL